MYHLITVPLYDTLGLEAIEYIITQTDMTTILVSKDKIGLLFELAKKMPKLKHVILMESLEDALVKKGKDCGLTVMSITDVEALGSENPHDPVPPTKDAIATICYTSGA